MIRCRPVGMLKMTDEAGGDAKILAVPVDKILPIYSRESKTCRICRLALEHIEHFFEHYKDLEKGKWVKIEGWGGADEAKKKSSPKR